MKTAAFVVGPALGHVSRTLLVADELARSGDVRVTFVSPAARDFAGQLLAERYETVLLPATERHEFTTSLQELTDSRTFDVVGFDMNPARWLEGYRRPDAPCAYITNAFLTRVAGLETEQVRKLRRRPWGRRGRGSAEGVYDLYEMDRVLLADPVPLARRYEPLPGHYRACGAVSWSPDDELPDELRDAADVLVVSMGSTGREPLSSRLIDDLVRASGCASVVVVGTQVSAIEQSSVPTRTYSRLSLRRLLPKAKLVVSSGGAGSTYLALEAGVPAVVWPSHRNHQILGEIIEQMGLGILVRDGQDVTRTLARSFGRIAAGARDFAPAASSRSGAEAAAAELRALMK